MDQPTSVTVTHASGHAYQVLVRGEQAQNGHGQEYFTYDGPKTEDCLGDKEPYQSESVGKHSGFHLDQVPCLDESCDNDKIKRTGGGDKTTTECGKGEASFPPQPVLREPCYNEITRDGYGENSESVTGLHPTESGRDEPSSDLSTDITENSSHTRCVLREPYDISLSRDCESATGHSIESNTYEFSSEVNIHITENSSHPRSVPHEPSNKEISRDGDYVCATESHPLIDELPEDRCDSCEKAILVKLLALPDDSSPVHAAHSDGDVLQRSGLWNEGNKCYLLSTLQFVFTIPSFKKRYFHGPGNDDNEFNRSMHIIARGLFQNEGTLSRVFDPQEFMRVLEGACPRFASYEQQDALECLLHIIRLTEENNRSTDMNPCEEMRINLTESFQEDEKRQKPPYLNTRIEYVLRVPVPNRERERHGFWNRFMDALVCMRPTCTVDLRSCIDLMLKKQIIIGLEGKSKETKFSYFPRYLVVSAPKFILDEFGNVKKSEVEVNIPLSLDIQEFAARYAVARKDFTSINADMTIAEMDIGEQELSMENEIGKTQSTSVRGNGVYELQAMIEHRGSSHRSGHYTCYIRHGSQWICCNDTSVETLDTLPSRNIGYICLYTTKTT